eukprot:1141305-Pelagomonas_calceolata.AAC.2
MAVQCLAQAAQCAAAAEPQRRQVCAATRQAGANQSCGSSPAARAAAAAAAAATGAGTWGVRTTRPPGAASPPCAYAASSDATLTGVSGSDAATPGGDEFPAYEKKPTVKSRGTGACLLA